MFNIKIWTLQRCLCLFCIPCCEDIHWEWDGHGLFCRSSPDICL